MYNSSFKLVKTDKILRDMVTLLAKINPDQADICTFVMEQINSRDYIGAATTVALSFPRLVGTLNDMPQILTQLSASLDYDCTSMLSALNDILADICKARVCTIIRREDDCYWLNHCDAITRFPILVANALERWRKCQKALTWKDVVQMLSQDVELPHDNSFCPNLSCVLNNHYGYYLPLYSKQTINPIFGSLYCLAKELIEFPRTGALHILLEISKQSANRDKELVKQAKLMVEQYATFLQAVQAAIRYNGTIEFFV